MAVVQRPACMIMMGKKLDPYVWPSSKLRSPAWLWTQRGQNIPGTNVFIRSPRPWKCYRIFSEPYMGAAPTPPAARTGQPILSRPVRRGYHYNRPPAASLSPGSFLFCCVVVLCCCSILFESKPTNRNKTSSCSTICSTSSISSTVCPDLPDKQRTCK